MPKVSVIIPVYKTEKYLRKCVDSVLCQTFKDYEVILVSDGPEEATLICEEYVQEHSNFALRTGVNKSLGGARNAGLEIASGGFVFFLDSDDWIEPNLLQETIACFDDTIDVVVFGFNLPKEGFCKKGSYGKNFELKYKGEVSLSDGFILNSNVNAWNKIFRKSVIDKHRLRFPENMEYEDFPFHFLYFLCSEKAFYLDKKLYNYLQRNDSGMVATYRHDYEKIKDHIAGCVFLRNELDRLGIFEANKAFFSRIYGCWVLTALNHVEKKDRVRLLDYAYENYGKMKIASEKDLVLELLEDKKYGNIIGRYKDERIKKVFGVPVMKIRQGFAGNNIYYLFTKIHLPNAKLKRILNLFRINLIKK